MLLGKSYIPQDPLMGKTYRPARQDDPPPPTPDNYPNGMRSRTEPVTSAVVPADERGEQAKRWAD